MEGLDVGSLFLHRSRDLLSTEFRTKLRAAVEALPVDALWWRPNESSNSAGNLLLHLMGNVRQWIVSGLGGSEDIRNRPAEFAARDGASRDDLLEEMDRLLDEVDRVLSTLTPQILLERRTIQGRDVTVFDALLTVVQHFSHHLGQIIWIAKLTAPGAIRFVDDAARPLWRERIRRP